MLFKGISVGKEEPAFVVRFMDDNDFSFHTRRAILNDLRKFAQWFTTVNKESFIVSTVDTFCSARDYLGVKGHDKTVKAADACVSPESGDKRV